MAVRKKCDISMQGAEPANEAVSACGNLGGRFTVRRAVPKEIPARLRFENVCGRASFVVAIVPPHEIRLDFGLRPKSNQRTRLLGASQRAGQYMRK